MDSAEINIEITVAFVQREVKARIALGASSFVIRRAVVDVVITKSGIAGQVITGFAFCARTGNLFHADPGFFDTFIGIK